MKKPFKVLTTTAMAAALAATSLTPVASVNAEAALTISEVVLPSIEGPLGKVEVGLYDYALAENKVDPTDVTHVVLNTGEAFDIEVYDYALAEANGDVQKALKLLKEQVDPSTDEILPGKFTEDGKVTVDVQPEDRLNETFFYNAA